MKLNKASVKSIAIAVRVLLIVLIVFLIVQAGKFAYNFGYSIFMDEAAASASESRTVEVTILEGSSARDIAKQLESLGVIKDANVFYIQAVLAGSSKDMQGGTYTLTTSMAPSEIIETLVEGADETE